MVERRILVLIAVLILAVLSGSVRAAEEAAPSRFAVDGAAAIIRMNEAEAQKRAIEDGLRRAVSQAVRRSVGDAAMEQHRQRLEKSILSASPQFVQRYRVLSRRVNSEDRLLQVHLEVTVDLSAVDETLRSLKLGEGDAKQARLLFLVDEHILRAGGEKVPVPLGGSHLGVSERRFVYDFARAGYTPIVPKSGDAGSRPARIRAAVSGNLDAARALGSLYGCPIVVTVRAVVERERGGTVVSLASARVIRVKDGAVIAVRSRQVRYRRPRGTRSLQTALSTASGRLGNSLLPEIRRVFPPSVGNAGKVEQKSPPKQSRR